MLSFWNSRNKLAIGSFVAVVLLALIDDPPIRRVGQKPEADLIQDVDSAMETMDYMNGLKSGKSYVRGVVEKETEVEEWYWSCRHHKPTAVSQDGWIENDGLFLYSAYFDERPNSLFPRNPAVQVPTFCPGVLLMSWRTLENHTDVFCTIHSDRGSAVVKGYVREIWQRAWDPRDIFYVPALVTCPIPIRLKNAKKATVFLTKKPCGRELSALEVKFLEKVEKTVAVCVKGMDFQRDISKELVQWFEAAFLFGAEKVTVYTYSIPKRVQETLKYYGKMGKVEEISLDLPGNSPNISPVRSAYIWRNRQQKRRHELIPYNDCLYRNMAYKWILILDTDEVVVPLKYASYGQMLDEVEGGRRISSVVIRNVFKFPENGTGDSDLFLLRNNKRSRKTSAIGEYGKSFTRTANVATVFNHFALHRLSPAVGASLHLPEDTAVKLHYKGKCPIESRHECEQLMQDTTIDTSLDRDGEELTKRVKKVLRDMGYDQ